MNLYLLTFDESDPNNYFSSNCYDYYDSLIVLATSPEEAKLIHPLYENTEEDLLDEFRPKPDPWSTKTWVESPERVIATFLGVAHPTLQFETSIVLSSFNQG